MKKIMFNDSFGLTQAVLDGRKTMTRRIVPKILHCGNVDFTVNPPMFEDCNSDWHSILETSYAYKVGEIVAISQSYKDIGLDPKTIIQTPIKGSKTKGVLHCEAAYSAGWTNKMFVRADLMPHQIRITNVRVERLVDISYDDILAEGISTFIDALTNIQYFTFENAPKDYISHRTAFRNLIDKVSGKGTWESSPFVFAYEFERVK